MKLKTTHIAALAAISLVGSASAASIYTDSLIGTGTALNGTVADTSSAFAGGTAGATWTAGAVNETATGAVYTGGQTGFLPVTITTGFVYTLQATIGSTVDWVALGFSDATGDGQWNPTNNKTAWGLVRPTNGGAPAFFGGPQTQFAQTWASTATGTQTLTITLDTTAPAWTTFASIGSDVTSTYTYATNPTINFVGFGQTVAVGSTSTITDFSLSAIPEPSAAILGAFGALALLRRRRA